MPCASGEYVAGELLKDNKKNTLIVFTTSHTEFAKYGYMYRAFRFIDKAELDEELAKALCDIPYS
jgi:DNA-binding LytR/AlgR family response regulator